jgi:hypothetical protein
MRSTTRSRTHAIEPEVGLYSGVDYHGMPMVISNIVQHVSLFREEKLERSQREEPHCILTTMHDFTSGPKNPSRGPRA